MQERKRQDGILIKNYAVYGYLKDGKKLEVDPYAAEIVREIFKLKIDGYNHKYIGEMLNKRGVLCPMEYKLSKGMSVQTAFKTDEKALWASNSIRRILENLADTGSVPCMSAR
jgi:hypothetical protein